ncbi:unnamed protein product, partial [Mesorhabditis belari]|uniref:Large ribosomal subunit protein eL22 n=1 Tax=Mesorhabditis belari TaxID=2138241 RepID=A0AAF3FHT2_9BILA
MVAKPAAKKTSKAGRKKKQTLKFNIECKNPVEDGILKVDDFENFLKEKIKVDGKTGQLESHGVKIDTVKSRIVVNSEGPFSKRYLKYLAKKYLKKNSLRDWLRIVASSKDTYELRYFHINQDEEEGSDNEA